QYPRDLLPDFARPKSPALHPSSSRPNFINELRDHITRVRTVLPRSSSATTPRLLFVGLSLWYDPAIWRSRAASRQVIVPAYIAPPRTSSTVRDHRLRS